MAFHERLFLTWMQIRGLCRFEHPAIRRRLKFYRYSSIVVAMILFAAMIAVMFIGRLLAMSAASAAHTDPAAAANAMILTLLPYSIGMIVFTFAAAEIIYTIYRAYLLRRLQNTR